MHSLKSPLIILVLVALGAWGLFVRLYGLGESSYWIDEGFTLVQAQAIAEHGYPLLKSGVVEWKDPLIPYLTAPFLFFVEVTDASFMRLWAAFFGAWSILVAFALARELYNWRAGLLFAFFVSTGYWFVAWSQQLRGYSALIFFVLMTFYLLILTERHKEEARLLWFAFLTCILATLSNKLGVTLFVPFFAYVIYLKRYRLLGLFVVCGIMGSGYLFGIVLSYVEAFEQNYRTFYTSHLLSGGPFFLSLTVVGFLFSYWKRETRFFHMMVLVWSLLTLVVLSYLILTGEKRYILVLFPVIYLYACAGMVFLAESFKKTRQISLVFLTILFACVVYIERHSLLFVPRGHYLLENYTPQADFAGAYDAIKNNGFGPGDKIISPFPWMDQIYLGRSDYSIPWSLTGKKDDVALIDGLGYYTGAPVISTLGQKDGGRAQLDALRQKGNVYILIDALSRKRMNQDLRHYIETESGSTELYYRAYGRDIITVYVFGRLDH